MNPTRRQSLFSWCLHTAVLPAKDLPVFIPACPCGWLLHSSGSVAEVQNHLDRFTRGTKGAVRSHWPRTRQAGLYASLTSLVWHFSCICPLPVAPRVTTTAVQKKIVVYKDINQMNNIWGQSAVSAPSLSAQLSCKVTIMTECQKCFQLWSLNSIRQFEYPCSLTDNIVPASHQPSSD